MDQFQDNNFKNKIYLKKKLKILNLVYSVNINLLAFYFAFISSQYCISSCCAHASVYITKQSQIKTVNLI